MPHHRNQHPYPYMRTEIITIGDEILIGQIIDTNSAFISKQLNKIGVQVYQITSVQDNREHILKALANARKRVQLVLVTGGLGPTKDDITKQAFLEYFNDTLVEDRAVREHIVSIFKKHLKREPLPSNLAQAMVPSKAMVLPNPYGTAPGMWLEKEGTVFVAMPGVPHEMENLLTNEVMPRVAKKFKRPYIYHTTLLTYGQGESEIQERAKHWENKLPPAIKLAYLPSIGRVRLRLSGNGTNKAALKTAVDRQMQQLQKILSDIAIGLEGETTIQQRIATALTAKNQTLSLAESCTGGAIASK
ncbi:MAG: molybdopterin-binding protein, partial [Marinirhabdus sp.]